MRLLQGAANHLSVYYAKKQHDTTNDKESCPARNAKLYFCGTPSGLRRDSILALFSAFGRVRHLQVYTDSYGVLSSGTVTMYSTDEAIEAMNSLDGKVLQPGTAPLKVSQPAHTGPAGVCSCRRTYPAGPQHAACARACVTQWRGSHSSSAVVCCGPAAVPGACVQVTWAQLSTLPRCNPTGGGPPPPMPRGFTVSYACIPTSVTPAEVAATFERFGTVLQVVPFAHRREGPLNSRGCGLVVMDREPAAMAAVEALSGVFTWPGAERPLLVQPFYERVSPDKSGGGLPAGAQQAGQFGRGGSSSGGGGMPRGPTNHHSAASAGVRGNAGRPGFQPQQQQWQGGHQGPRGPPTAAEAPPPGCAPDVFKLVLANLPGSYTHTDVVSLLQPYGTVMSLTVMPAGDLGRDSSAAVWYASASQAEAALSALSNTVLMAAEGTRQLEVKAFKRPLGQYLGANSMQRGMQQGQAPGLGGGAWHSPHATQGLTGMQQQQQQHSPGMAAYQQPSPVSHQQGLLQQGGYGPAGHVLQQQAAGGLMGVEQHVNNMWVQAGSTSGGTSPDHLGLQGGDSNLSALSAAMSAGPNAYSMQQLLSMLPQQQQQHPVACVMLPGGGAGAWPGNMVMPGGAVSLSSTSNLDGTLQSFQGGNGTDPGSLINPSVSTSLLAPAGPGAGYTGWLG